MRWLADWRMVVVDWRVAILLHAIAWIFLIGSNISTGLGAELSLGDAVLRSTINIGLIAILFYLTGWSVNRLLEKDRLILWLICLIVLLLSFQLIRIEVYKHYPYSLGILTQWDEYPLWTPRIVLATNVLTMAFSTISYLLDNRMKAARIENEMAKRQQEAELKMLRAQINPHFLFNSLHNIYAMAVTGSTKTADAILKISDLLRYVIYETGTKRVTLRREIELLEKYADLFRLKSDPAPQIDVTTEGDIDAFLIEPMILVPLLENAFKHGNFDQQSAFAKISIQVQDNGLLACSCLNTYDENDQQKDQQSGVGLENIQQRLELRYSGKHQFEIKKSDNQFRAILQIQLDRQRNQG
jgi:sensor histidine kinase YesM